MPVIKKYTHLFFDLDNTLWDFESNSIIAMEDAFNKFIFSDTKIDFDLFKNILFTIVCCGKPIVQSR